MSRYRKGSLWELAGPAAGVFHGLVLADGNHPGGSMPEVLVVPATPQIPAYLIADVGVTTTKPAPLGTVTVGTPTVNAGPDKSGVVGQVISIGCRPDGLLHFC